MTLEELVRFSVEVERPLWVGLGRNLERGVVEVPYSRAGKPTGYKRAPVTFRPTVGAPGEFRNRNAAIFPTALSGWGTISHFFLFADFDSDVSHTCDPVVRPRRVNVGDLARFNVGDLVADFRG